MFIMVSIPVFASSDVSLPSINDLIKDNPYYFITSIVEGDKTTYWLYVSENPFSVASDYISTSDTFLMYQYDGKTYTEWSGGVSGYVDVCPSSVTLIYSGQDIKDSDGNVFFSRKPLMSVEALIKEAKTIPKQLVGYLRFLVPLGIGLMACLIGLVVLRKVLSILGVHS